MLLPNDFLHRLQALKLRRASGFGTHSNKMLLEWTVLLFFGLLLVLGAFAYATYRFSYWSNLENNLSNNTVVENSSGTDREEVILREFDRKAIETEEILGRSVVSVPEASSSTVRVPEGSPVSAE